MGLSPRFGFAATCPLVGLSPHAASGGARPPSLARWVNYTKNPRRAGRRLLGDFWRPSRISTLIGSFAKYRSDFPVKATWMTHWHCNDISRHSNKWFAITDYSRRINPLSHSVESPQVRRLVLTASICRQGNYTSTLNAVKAEVEAGVAVPGHRRDDLHAARLPPSPAPTAVCN